MSRTMRFRLGGSLLFLILGFIIGLLIGTSIGGNYFTDFTFLTYRGYEAVEVIGAAIGSLLGILVGGQIGVAFANRKQPH